MPSIRFRAVAAGTVFFSLVQVGLLAENVISDEAPLSLPPPGAHQLRVLAPDLLELSLVTTKGPGAGPANQWDFINRGQFRAPAAGSFLVLTGGKTNRVIDSGFKRRVLYAPLKQRDLRIANSLYLKLAVPIADNSTVEVQNPDQKLWPAEIHFVAKADPLRWSPAIHVNQVGYLPAGSKVAMVGYYLGSLGEMDLSTNAFEIVDAQSTQSFFQGRLTLRRDEGFSSYQRVMQADFSDFKQPGEYRLLVPRLGTSFPFRIDHGVAATDAAG